jgi:hypothetical protein
MVDRSAKTAVAYCRYQKYILSSSWYQNVMLFLILKPNAFACNFLLLL